MTAATIAGIGGVREDRAVAVWLVTRAALRRHWRGLLAVALLVGIAGAAVLTAAAGARRTSTALDRFRSYSHSADVMLDVGTPPPSQLAAMRRFPTVASVGVLYQFVLNLPNGELFPGAAAVDSTFGRTVDRSLLVEGRHSRPTRADEITLSEAFARRLHVHVGDTVSLTAFTPEQVELSTTGVDVGAGQGPKVTLHVVGIVRRPLDLGVRGDFGGIGSLTPAFYEQYRDRIGTYVGNLLRIRTKHGASDVPATIAAGRRIFGPSILVESVASETSGAGDAIDVLTIALWIFAGVAALAGLTAIVIVTTRQLASEQRDQQTLAALGLSTRQRASAVALLAVPAAVGGAVVAVTTALLLSPLLPFGIARKAEVDPGVHVDALVLGLGFLAIVALVLAVAAATAWHVARAPDRDRAHVGSAHPSAAARAAARAGANPRLTIGLRMALEPGRGSDAVPVRSAFLGATFGTLGIVAVLVFGGSLDHLVATPPLYGAPWDAVLDVRQAPPERTPAVCGDVELTAARDRRLAAIEAICLENVEVQGHPVTVWGMQPIKGSIGPTIVEGRAPRRSGEIVLGSATLDAIGKQVGDTVRVRGPEATQRLRVVGQVVFASLGSDDPEPLADGAAVTGVEFARLAGPQPAPNMSIVARFAPGVDPDRLPRTNGQFWKFTAARGSPPILPAEVSRLQQVDDLPLILGGLLALLATVAVGHAVVLGIRRRRRELAVLRTIGFERRDVRASIAYQSTILTVLGMLVGIPLGVVTGRLIWRAVADGLGVAARFDLSLPDVAVVAVGAVVVANAIGALAASASLRDRPAVTLAAE